MSDLPPPPSPPDATVGLDLPEDDAELRPAPEDEFLPTFADITKAYEDRDPDDPPAVP